MMKEKLLKYLEVEEEVEFNNVDNGVDSFHFSVTFLDGYLEHPTETELL